VLILLAYIPLLGDILKSITYSKTDKGKVYPEQVMKAQRWLSCNLCCSGKSDKYYIFWVCICNLTYPARKAHKPYCHLWPVRLYNNFSTLSNIWYDFRKRFIHSFIR